MAADWIGINSSHIDSFCGEGPAHTLAEALNGSEYWEHIAIETHEFVIDLGAVFNITKFRGRSKQGLDPIDIDIYVSNDKGDWGAAVATTITTWQDTLNWVEIDSTDKEGRYIKVEIIDTETGNFLEWGGNAGDGYFTIFDAYGEEVGGDVTVSPSVLALELDLLTPTILVDEVTVSPFVLALELDLLSPTILVGEVTVSPSVLALELDLLSPTILVGEITISPDVLALELELLAPTILISDVPITVMPDVLALELELLAPRVGPVFPTLSTSPEYEGWVDEYGDETVIRDSYASGYPLLNPQFTFDPKNFRHVLRRVSQADKETIVSFYNSSKSQEMFWLNEQDGEIYFVVFTRKPRCQSDGARSMWKLELNLRQVAEL